MTTTKDEAIAFQILEVIKADLLHMMSWGFSDPTIIENGLLFRVRGLIHKGKVMVTLNECTGLFHIQIIGKKNKVKNSIEDVRLDNLINVLDLQIERVDNYGEVIAKMFGLPTKEQRSKESK